MESVCVLFIRYITSLGDVSDSTIITCIPKVIHKLNQKCKKIFEFY